jgi:uncharacterized protein with HEPN domain
VKRSSKGLPENRSTITRRIRSSKYAIERLFTIIGEALREASWLEPELANRITGYRRIIDFRNLLLHGYATVYDEGVWRIIEENLPLLLNEVRASVTPDDER